MSRQQSPGYPNFSLQKAVDRVRKIFEADRTAEIDRETAAIHLGYSSLSGASDKAIASLVHYGLLERATKGHVRVSKIAVDILHPDRQEDRKRGLREAAFSPQVFRAIKERFPDAPPSEHALKSWLVRESYQDRAVGPVTLAYLETCRYLEQEKVSESAGPSASEPAESEPSDREVQSSARFGGAKIGDFVQWESNGVLKFDKPRRVRYVFPDGDWIAVEGSETGIHMSEVIVQELPSTERGSPPRAPEEAPAMPYLSGKSPFKVVQEGNKLHIEARDLGAAELGKLLMKLEKYKEILEMDDEKAGGQ